MMRGAKVIVLSSIILLSLLSNSTWAAVFHVNGATGDDSENGFTWAGAKKTVQAGINAASANDQVWVTEGTYVEQITLKSGVALYAGFAGDETLLEERDWQTNVTILDGNDNGSVVTIPSGASSSTKIDGFIIRNGTGTLINGKRYGGGIYCGFGSAAIIAHNKITGNTADIGAGIYTYGNTSNAITANPVNLNLVVGETGSITFSIPEPATAGGRTIILSSSSPIVATVPATVQIPEGQQSVDVNVSTVGYGKTTITANSSGLEPAHVSVDVINPPLLAFSPSPLNVAAGLVEKCTVTSANPAPAGGLTINMTGGTGKVEIPASVTILEAQTSTIFNAKGLIEGTATIDCYSFWLPQCQPPG